ncbi:MAG TPA: hypothetical protein VH325_03720, partial [Bryobacteraceae bacterium]|nr:hypothetical protein [Bryobacteraceae bacterium]
MAVRPQIAVTTTLNLAPVLAAPLYFVEVTALSMSRARFVPLVLSFATFFWSAEAALCQWIPDNPVTSVDRQPNGLRLGMQQGELLIEVCTPTIIHVIYSPTATVPKHANYVVT